MSKTTKPTDIGPNRTGIAVSPVDSKRAEEGAREATPNPVYDTAELDAMRVSYSRDAAPLGTVPPPASVKGAAKAAVGTIKGQKPTVFLDLIGERLAFERTGTRLYESLLCRFDAASVHSGGPTRADLELIRNQELEHFGLLIRAMQKMGADPTAVTPCADVAGVASNGLLAAVSDPRTTLTEGLKATLIAELADNDGWLVLADLAARLGHDDLASEFRRALVEEEEHLARVRSWLAASIEGQAGITPTPEVKRPEQPAPIGP